GVGRTRGVTGAGRRYGSDHRRTVLEGDRTGRSTRRTGAGILDHGRESPVSALLTRSSRRNRSRQRRGGSGWIHRDVQRCVVGGVGAVAAVADGDRMSSRRQVVRAVWGGRRGERGIAAVQVGRDTRRVVHIGNRDGAGGLRVRRAGDLDREGRALAKRTRAGRRGGRGDRGGAEHLLIQGARRTAGEIGAARVGRDDGVIAGGQLGRAARDRDADDGGHVRDRGGRRGEAAARQGDGRRSGVAGAGVGDGDAGHHAAENGGGGRRARAAAAAEGDGRRRNVAGATGPD